jgi:hypothetical protein
MGERSSDQTPQEIVRGNNVQISKPARAINSVVRRSPIRQLHIAQQVYVAPYSAKPPEPAARSPSSQLSNAGT